MFAELLVMLFSSDIFSGYNKLNIKYRERNISMSTVTIRATENMRTIFFFQIYVFRVIWLGRTWNIEMV